MSIRKTFLKRTAALALALLCGLLFAGCGTGGADALSDPSAAYADVTVDESGTVVIPTAGITGSARFYNYDADGVTVQLVALRDAQDGVHIAFNTCQNCTPSPKAFYTQEGDVLKCENCGFTFAAEEVGIVHGGCNPWPIDGVEITADTVVIPAAALDAMKASFARWGGPVK